MTGNLPEKFRGGPDVQVTFDLPCVPRLAGCSNGEVEQKDPGRAHSMLPGQAPQTWRREKASEEFGPSDTTVTVGRVSTLPVCLSMCGNHAKLLSNDLGSFSKSAAQKNCCSCFFPSSSTVRTHEEAPCSELVISRLAPSS